MAIENAILKGSLRDFAEQFELQEEAEDKQFEYFVNFCVGGKFAGQETVGTDLLDNMSIGNGQDWGIDGFLIIVNGEPINSVEELQQRNHREWRISIIITQAKTSKSLDVGELQKFLSGIRDIIRFARNEQKLPPYNEDLSRKLEIIKYLYDHSEKFSSFEDYKLPRLNAFYVHSGNNTGDENHSVRIQETKEMLEDNRYTLDNTISILPCDDIREIYSQLKSRVVRTIEVDYSVPLPDVSGIDESYLCLIKFREFQKLMEETDGKIMSGMFEDNIRHFQGNNPVNQAIAKTIKDGEINLFTALNNGLTIMGKPAELRGKRLTIADYQVVNGCQTCHVLYNYRLQPGIEDLTLMVKVISSADRTIRDKIVVANNNQTAVLREQLTSLHQIQRNIEDYFKYRNSSEKLYYERRSKQYQYGNTSVPAGRVITIPYMIKAFVSMILGKPHMTSRYYGQLLELFEGEDAIFKSDTDPALYYASALAAFRRDEFLRHNRLPRKYINIKHHLLQVLPYVITGKNVPQLNSNKVSQFCDMLCDKLEKRGDALAAFEQAGKLIEEVLGRVPIHKDLNDEMLSLNLRKLCSIK